MAGQEAGLRLRVARRGTIADGVLALELRDPRGADLPVWTAGAHIDLRLPGGLVRQYSLCGDPAERAAWQIAVLREAEGRGGSAYVHDHLHEGSAVEASLPRNHFPLRPSPRYVFIAGGIGITPILPMIVAAEAAGARWELHYGGRSERSMAFLDRLGAHTTLYPQDQVGLIDLDRLLGTPRRDTLVYCCGPEPLLAAAEQRCAAWPPGTLRLERFAPRETSGPARAESFEVELTLSGLTLTVPPHRSILEVVEAAGVPVLSSCQEGTCGSCETTVLDGAVEHRDSVLSAAEQAAGDIMLICVSRGAGPKLVLEL